MKNLITILLILLIFIMPMFTSLMLDWDFVQQQTSRQIIVHLLMIVEAAICIMLLLNYLKNIK